MVRTISRREAGIPDDDEFVPNGGRIPRLSGDLRPLIPKLGLREYWYPALGERRVSKKHPTRIAMLGEDLCLFRDKDNQVVALTDYCPHRGARLSEGNCHYAGTIACSYHGWVFDGGGKNIAVLSEGPHSLVCGKPGTEAKKYPTKVLKGIVFVWMGEGEPAPIEEDVPEEFFNPRAYILFNDRIYWKTNWEVALENSMDAHVQYLHRDNLRSLLGNNGVRSGGSSGQRPIFTGNGFRAGGPPRARNAGQPSSNGNGATAKVDPNHDVYPEGWRWPKHRYRRLWSWFFSPILNLLSIPQGPIRNSELWGSGHHLPGMFRAGGGGGGIPMGAPRQNFIKRLFSGGGGSLFGLYTRQVVPVDDWKTRVWYHHYTLPANRLHKAWIWFNYFTLGRWTSEYNFSQQDMSVMLNQRYDVSEKLAGTDAEVVQWRRLVVTKHFGGRNAHFEQRVIEEIPQEEQAEQTPVLAKAGVSQNDG
jgi:nitrite reductase/ring-hydroxylating ferredoxin subunit